MNNLAIMIDNFIDSKGIKKAWIAEQLGISQQLLRKRLNKKNFTVDDANKILAIIGYKIDYQITEINETTNKKQQY